MASQKNEVFQLVDATTVRPIHRCHSTACAATLWDRLWTLREGYGGVQEVQSLQVHVLLFTRVSDCRLEGAQALVSGQEIVLLHASFDVC